MKTRTAVVGACVLLSVVVVCCRHRGTISAMIPDECPDCRRPGILKGPVADIPGYRWYRCLFCGVRFKQKEGTLGKTQPIPWKALILEMKGETDSGPVKAGQKLPKTD